MCDFTPRPCQVPMIEMITRLPRCNIFASPGTGKTSATLFALMNLQLLGEEVFPALVVAPKRVANSVWDAEVEAWSVFDGVKVEKMVGPKAKREAALRRKAHIYTINPANLPWLSEQVGNKWPFRTVVCDESTTIKNHRVHFRKKKKGGWAQYRGGTKQAASLVERAIHTKRWINLTGTPSPNGVKDLWGQQWPIDFGKALGRTYTAFSQRWFKPVFGSTPEQQRIEPLPFAEDEIVDRIRDTTVVVDAYDWFDIHEPIEVDMKVVLPPKAKKIYDRLHSDSVLELEESGFDVFAANAGALLMKCRQIASGHLKDDDGRWHTVHDAKLEALEELIEKLNGEPLLCAYWFKEDVAAIKRKFKYAEELPSDHRQKAVEDRWNEGKIPLLIVSPQSAGHGLNLQHGGNNLCFYTADWNGEYRDQVIERIGPTRQAQSGYDRMVYVHNIVAQGTWETAVLAAVRNKWDVQQGIREALK